MLSTTTRIKLEDIAARIAGGLNVTLEEMTFIQKWANANNSAAAILRKARRKAISGEPAEGSIDELMQGLDLGFPDPSDHLSGPQNPVDLANWFSREDESTDWRQRD